RLCKENTIITFINNDGGGRMSKMRVYEYAKQNDVTSKEVIEALGKLNVDVKNHMSTIAAETVEQLNKQLQKEKQAPKKEAAKQTTPKKTVQDKQEKAKQSQAKQGQKQTTQKQTAQKQTKQHPDKQDAPKGKKRRRNKKREQREVENTNTPKETPSH